MLVELGYEVALVGHRAPAWPRAEPPEGIAAYEEFRLGGMPLVRSFELGRELCACVERLRPALVHAHWLPEYGWLAARAGLHPLVSSAWGSDVLAPGLVGRRRARAAIRGADLVLADSAVLAEAARALAPGGAPVQQFHPGVDLDRFRPFDRDEARGLLGWRREVPVVLSARTLSPQYNPLTVIRAFALVRATLPDARLVLKHPVELVPRTVTDAIGNLGLADHIDIIGHVDAATMPHLYQAADVVVSVPSSDSSPATAWEALACGRPLVVSELPWAGAELRHGENAWATPIDDHALAKALARLLRDRELAAELGARGRALAGSAMDRRDRMRELDECYRALVAASVTARPSGAR